MKFEKPSVDDVCFGMTAAAQATYAVHAMGFPKHFQDTYFAKEGRSNDLTRFYGHVLGCLAAKSLLSTGDNMTKDGRVNMHKLAGVLWGTVAGHQVYNVSKNIQKRDPINYANVGVCAGLSALHLYRGFKKDDEGKEKKPKEEKKEKKEKKKEKKEKDEKK